MHRIILSGEYLELIESLASLECSIALLTAENPLLPHPVRFHADLQFLRLSDKKAFVLKNSDISIDNYSIYKSKESPSDKYPRDCLLNCLIIGDKAFGNAKALDEYLLEYLKNSNFEFINVKQGYAKCSTLVVDEKHAITADCSIYKALTENDIDVLKIENGNILLPGYDYGFIGGASGKLGNSIIFTGSIKTHPQGSEIARYIKSCGLEIIELNQGKLIDIGGIIEL